VFNPKLCGIAGGAAFVFSLLIGLVSGAGFPIALLRALIFGAVFVVLAAGAYWLAGQFLPELLSGSGDEADMDLPGSRVDISVEGDEAQPGAWQGEGAELPEDAALGLDQNGEDGYTKKGVVEENSSGGKGSGVPAGSGAAIPLADQDQDSVDILPDLESVSGVFLAPAGEEGAPAPQRSAGGNKPENLDGDFNPKEMASAIQTILKRENKG
jgi:hypothetical protein